MLTHDVDDLSPQIPLDNLGVGSAVSHDRIQQPDANILSRLRKFNLNRLMMPSIGSFFATDQDQLSHHAQDGISDNLTLNHDTWDNAYDPMALRTSRGDEDSQVLQSGVVKAPRKSSDGLVPVATTRSTTSLPSSRFADVKTIFQNLTRSRPSHAQKHSLSQTRSQPTQTSDIQLSEYSTRLYDKQRPMSTSLSGSASSGSDFLKTPPLTPDTSNGQSLSSQLSNDSGQSISGNERNSHWHANGHRPSEDTDSVAFRSHSLKIKEGKKPERPICYDTLIEDITGLPRDSDLLGGPTENTSDQITPTDEKDEWYGLEYTLELSSRERRPSVPQISSIGEHSKSRESWAAIHQGTVHPFFEDEDYFQWKNWHRFLDKQDEQRRHRRIIDFKARSKELAWYYADEMRTRDIMNWQMEVYGMVGNDVKERLIILSKHRPDPYYPAKEHELGWHLKRSRSIATIRELHALPEIKSKCRAAKYV